MVDQVVPQGVDPWTARKIWTARTCTGNLAECTGRRQNGQPAPGRIEVGGRPGLVGVLAAAGCWQVYFPAMLQRGQEAALGKVEGVIVGCGYRVDAQPLQLVQVAGV
jgi:hypothetical protein